MRGLEHKIWHREGFWHVVSDFVGFFADVDVRAFEKNRVQVGLSFVKEDRIGNVGSNIGGALAGESQPLKKNSFLFRCSVLDVLVPVIVELLYSVDLLVFVGEFEEVVGCGMGVRRGRRTRNTSTQSGNATTNTQTNIPAAARR